METLLGFASIVPTVWWTGRRVSLYMHTMSQRVDYGAAVQNHPSDIRGSPAATSVAL